MVVGLTTTYAIILWVLIPLMRGVLDTTLCDKVCQWLAAGWFSPIIPVSSTNKADYHDISEIMLKVLLNTITLTLMYTVGCSIDNGILLALCNFDTWIQSLVFFIVFVHHCLSFCPFSVNHCIVWFSLITYFSVNHCIVWSSLITSFSVNHCIVWSSLITSCSVNHCIVWSSLIAYFPVNHCIVWSSLITSFSVNHCIVWSSLITSLVSSNLSYRECTII